MSRKKDNTKNKAAKSGWVRALAEAERQMREYKQKLYELTRSAQIMREKIASGESWAGE